MIEINGVQFARFTQEEQQAVAEIISRAAKLFAMAGQRLDRTSLEMDLAAVHAHTPLRLADLAVASDINLAHDVVGIMRNIDRSTGRLANHFLPRFTAPQKHRRASTSRSTPNSQQGARR